MEQTAQGPLKAPAVPVHWTEGDIIVPGKWTATATTAAVADAGAEGITTIVANDLKAERFTYPGPLARAIPSFAMDLPAGWQVSEYPGSLFAMRCAEPIDGGWGNVIVQHQRVLAETTLESVAQATWLDFVQTDALLTVQYEYVLFLGENLHYLREVVIGEPDSPENVSRVDSFVFAPPVDEITSDLFQFTWLNPTTTAKSSRELYIKLMASFRFT